MSTTTPPSATSEGLARLHTEVRNAVAVANNSLAMRSAHPTYGYSKQRVRDELARVYTLVEAHMYATGEWQQSGLPIRATLDDYAKTKLDVDTAALAQRVKDEL